jgi:hypothetical protein
MLRSISPFALSPFLLFSFLLFSFLPSASAQRFIGGVAAGINLTQVDGDEVFGYTKVGFNGGPYVKLMLDKKQRFSITMELLYSQKGAQKKYPAPNGVRVALADTAFFDNDPKYVEENTKFFYNLRTDYLEIPLVVHFEDPRSKVGIGIGITWGRLVYIKEMEHNFTRLSVNDTTWQIRGSRRIDQNADPGRYKKNDWGFIADVHIPIYKGLKFNFRFQYSMAPFGKSRTFYNSVSPNHEGSVTRRPFHNTLTFRLIYSFNEKYTENTNYDRDGNRMGAKWIRDPEAMRW